MVHIMIQNAPCKLFCSIGLVWPNSAIKPVLNSVSSGAPKLIWSENSLIPVLWT